MAKNTLSLEVEKIAKKVANEVLKNHPLMISMAQWHSAFTAENKNIRDANRILELRIIQLEKEIEFLKKQSVSNIAEGESQPPPEESTPPPVNGLMKLITTLWDGIRNICQNLKIKRVQHNRLVKMHFGLAG